MNKNELPIYSYNNIRGVLIADDNEKIEGIEPACEGISYNFYSLDSLPDNIEDVDCGLTTDDAYGFGYDGETDIVEKEVICYENAERTCEEWVSVDYYNGMVAEETLLRDESPIIIDTERSKMKKKIEEVLKDSVQRKNIEDYSRGHNDTRCVLKEKMKMKLNELEKQYEKIWDSYDTSLIEFSPYYHDNVDGFDNLVEEVMASMDFNYC